MVRLGILIFVWLYAVTVWCTAKVLFSGNQAFSKETLAKQMEQIDSPEQVIHQITNFYRANGFFEAQISSEYKPVSDHWRKRGYDSILRVSIIENQPRLITQVSLEGISREQSKKMEPLVWELLKEKPHKYSKHGFRRLGLTSGTFLWREAVLQEGVIWITDELKNQGYLNAKVRGPIWTTEAASSKGVVHYLISLGPQSFIKEVQLIDCEEPEVLQIVEKNRIKAGNHLEANALEEARFLIAEYFWNHGYPDANVHLELMPGTSKEAIRVVFRATKGPLSTIKETVFRGSTKTRRGILEKQIQLKEGEIYSEEKIKETRANLFKLDLFQKVNVLTEKSETDPSERKLVIEVEDRPRSQVELGVGLSLDDGPRVALVHHLRNVLGTHSTLRTKLQINYPSVFYSIPFLYSPQINERFYERFKKVSPWLKPILYSEGKFLISFDKPRIWTWPLPVGAGVDLSLQRELKQAFSLNRISNTWRTRLNFSDKLWLSPQLEGEFTNFTCTTDPFAPGRNCGEKPSSFIARLDAGNVWLGTFKLLFAYDSRDDILFPKKGFHFGVEHDLAIGRVYGSNSATQAVRYSKLQSEIAYYFSLPKSLVLSTQLRAGAIIGLGRGTYVPLYKRFYLGGTQSVRGFYEDTILPADAPSTSQDSLSYGGNFFLNLRQEFRFPIYGKLQGAIFADAGELLIHPLNFSFRKIAFGTGVGIRYHTPIGPLIVDVGSRIYDGNRFVSSLKEALHLHFSIGYP